MKPVMFRDGKVYERRVCWPEQTRPESLALACQQAGALVKRLRTDLERAGGVVQVNQYAIVYIRQQGWGWMGPEERADVPEQVRERVIVVGAVGTRAEAVTIYERLLPHDWRELRIYLGDGTNG